jgi:hypothetical protein
MTLAPALQDSPLGLLSWLFEKFHAWSEPGSISKDTMLSTFSLYWFTQSIGTSFRLYHELMQPQRSWCEPHLNVVRYSRGKAGGHFASVEQPGDFVADLRATLPKLGPKLLGSDSLYDMSIAGRVSRFITRLINTPAALVGWEQVNA